MKTQLILVLLALCAMESFGKNLLTQRFGAMERGRSGDRSGSRDKSGVGERSGSSDEDASGSEEDLDWLEIISKECKIPRSQLFLDDEEVRPVNAGELNAALSNISAYMNNATTILGSQTSVLEGIEASLDGASLSDLVAHRDLFDQFRGAALNATTGGLCHFIRLSLLSFRLEMAGPGRGFNERGNCAKSLRLIKNLYEGHSEDYSAILETLAKNTTILRRLSRTVAADMSCIMWDVADFRDYILLINSTQGAKLSLRQITMGIASIQAFGSMVTKEIYTYYYVVEHVMLILDHLKETARPDMTTPEPTTPEPTTASVRAFDGSDLKMAMDDLRSLISSLDNMAERPLRG